MDTKKNDIPLTNVTSSNVKAVGYDARTQRIAVAFHSGSIYHYFGVDQKTADSITEAKSVGSAVHSTLVKGSFKYECVEKTAKEG